MPRGRVSTKVAPKRVAAKPTKLTAKTAKTVTPVKAAPLKRQIGAPRKAPSSSPAKSQNIKRSAHPGISITLQIPPLRRRKKIDKDTNIARVSWSRRLVPLFMILPIVALGLFAFQGSKARQHKPATAAAAAASSTEPAYQPLVPSAADASKPQYDSKRKIVSYTTNFSQANITVSQQPLPANFTKDPNALVTAANSINAKQSVVTERGTVYIATNEKDGDQMGLFADKQVLLFIRTKSKMTDASWKSFIELLQDKSWSDVAKDSKG